MVKLGQTVKDLVTGFEGVAVCRADYLHGMPRVDVQPPIKKDGSVPDEHAFDESQLVIIKKTPMMKILKAKQLIKLGQKVIDPVTDYQGIAFGRAVYLNGCSRICVASKHKEGEKYKSGVWFDEPQLKIVQERRKVAEGKKWTGGPAPIKTSRQY